MNVLVELIVKKFIERIDIDQLVDQILEKLAEALTEMLKPKQG